MNHTLDMAVREYLIASGDNSPARYARAYQSAVAGLREMKFDVSGTPVFCALDVSDTDTAVLPSDFVKETRIGVIANGNLWVDLGTNGNILPPGSVVNNCGNPTITTSSPVITGANFAGSAGTGPFGYGWSLDSPADNWQNGEFMGRGFGAGGGTNANGYYKIFRESGLIQFECLSTRTVVMEYLADLETDPSGNFPIHPFLYEPLQAFIHWGLIRFNNYKSEGEKSAAEMRWLKAKRHAKSRFLSNTAALNYQIPRTANSPTPKM